MLNIIYGVIIIKSPQGPCTDLQQDLKHILWQCPLYNSERKTHYKNLVQEKMFPPFLALTNCLL